LIFHCFLKGDGAESLFHIVDAFATELLQQSFIYSEGTFGMMENGLSEIALRKPANPYIYWSKWTCIYIDLIFWWRRGESNPCPKANQQKHLRV
jgi:hypothetical protein